MHLVVGDIEEARGALSQRGIPVGEIQDLGGVKYAPFSDGPQAEIAKLTEGTHAIWRPLSLM